MWGSLKKIEGDLGYFIRGNRIPTSLHTLTGPAFCSACQSLSKNREQTEQNNEMKHYNLQGGFHDLQGLEICVSATPAMRK